MSKFDFSGYVTKNDLRCTDGRTIRKNAFAHQDGMSLPLVWSHQRTSPMDVLGHIVLENRDDGVYGYGSFNDTELGQYSKQLVQHGDIVAMSIYANDLKQRGGDVLHGSIKEVSLVMAGANPGALIDNVVIQHSDGSTNQLDDEAYIFCGEEFEEVSLPGREIEHEDSESGETVADIWNTLSEKQKTVVYALIGEAISNDSDEAKHSDEEEYDMKYNVFDDSAREKSTSPTLSHSDMNNLIQRARDSKADSLKAVFEESGMSLSHAPTEDRPNGIDGIDYGVANLDVLLPEYRNVRDMPDLIARDDAWVSIVMGGVSKVPFSRIKTMTVDITADIARARGYRKGHLKKEEVIKMAKRVTGPTTIYKKQRLDRDDIVDISNFNIVAYLKSEMQRMLREELARAILVGDGRPELIDGKANEDKIEENCIRPILKEDELYAFSVDLDFSDPDRDARYRKLIDDIAITMIDYNGSGNTRLFTTKKHHTMMRMIRDKIDHKLYSSDSELYSALGVGGIVDTPIMEGVTDEEGREIIGIIVDLRDYTIGMNNGGQTTFFDDFDIDFNQYKYLYETRLSGALTRPDSAVILKASKLPPLHIAIDGADEYDDLDLGSKTASDIQENVAVSTTGNISGVLKYVENWSEYAPGQIPLQSGNFLAVKIENDGTDSGATVSARITNDRYKGKFEEVNSSNVYVCRVKDEMNQRLEVRITGSDERFETKVYNLSGLRLEKKE